MEKKRRQGKGGIWTFKDPGNPKAIATLNQGMGLNGGGGGNMCEDITPFTLNEAEDIFDYGTGDFEDPDDIFSTKTTGVSYYDQLINDPEYMEKERNLKGDIVMMTPRDYFEECAYNIFDTTPERLKEQRKRDTQSITTIRDVLLKHNRRLPLTYLNYADRCQEGLHRMYVAGELFGWDKKYPVLVVNWADPKRAEEDKRNQDRREIYNNLAEGIEDSLEYNYSNYEDWIDQLGWSLNRAFFGLIQDEQNVRYDVKDKGDTFIVEVEDVEVEVDKEDIKIKEYPDEDDDWDIDDNDWLDEYDLDNMSIADLDRLLSRH